MHGVIFTSFRDYLAAAHGADVSERVFDSEPVYLLSESYEDERLLAVVERAAEIVGTDADDVVHSFGVYAGETTFTRLYPAFFDISPSARDLPSDTYCEPSGLIRASPVSDEMRPVSIA